MPYGRNSELNLAALPIHELHELHQGVFDELKISEDRVLFVVKDIKSHNAQLAEEASRAMQDRDAVIVHRQELEDNITQTCIELPKLLIQIEAISKEKLKNMEAAVKESKAEVERVKFEM